MGDFVGAWKDMERAVKEGKVKALGISNFDANEEVWNAIMDSSTIKPAVLQIECHPYAQRLDMRRRLPRQAYRWSAGSRWAGRCPAARSSKTP